ncbi:eukaryotic aspartyl protease family protein [Striga asiatica]|uniref:Eukaryotic aspartyl protease family protein n=1 Tax=Striga asiatica TaxID=4170 RepID=A0A5A7QUS7_STRAF|nr:eukaryotic aspartyl protease family protein [Striga asiatica]
MKVNPCAQHTKAGACFPVRTSFPSEGANEYVFAVTVGLGTPPTPNSLILDATSNIMWTQCMPCLVSYNPQRDPIFEPRKSSSYSAFSFDSPQCSLLYNETIFGPSYSPRNTCVYSAPYYNFEAVSIGFLSRDKLTSLHPNNDDCKSSAAADIVFGCSQSSWGQVVGVEAGYMGLGKGNFSIVSQTAANSYFSYCLPSNNNSLGFLALGKEEGWDKYNNNNTRFTPLLTNLPVFSGGTLISTVSTFGILPPQAYAPLSREFKKQMINNHGFTSAPPYTTKDNNTLDTCFFTPNNTTKPATVPIVTFTFKNNVEVDLDASGTLFVVDKSIVCLAYIGKDDDPLFSVLFANTQQKTYEVVFDVAGKRVGFLPNSCP